MDGVFDHEDPNNRPEEIPLDDLGGNIMTMMTMNILTHMMILTEKRHLRLVVKFL